MNHTEADEYTKGSCTVAENHNQNISQHIALFFTPSRVGGGVGKSLLNQARAYSDPGNRVDLLVSRAEGPYLQQVPTVVNLVILKPTSGERSRLRALFPAEYQGLRAVLLSLLLVRTFRYLPDLVRYLQQQQPTIL